MTNETSTPGQDAPAERTSDICQFVTFVVGDEIFAVDLAPVQEIICAARYCPSSVCGASSASKSGLTTIRPGRS